jgi:hypothetical protein
MGGCGAGCGWADDLEPEMKATRRPGELNDTQQRRLRVSCQYIDKLLCNIEHALHSAASQSPFPRYVMDISDAQGASLEEQIRGIRAQLLRTLAWQHMEPNQPDIPVTRLVTANLAFAKIAIEELRPRTMRGSGTVPEDAIDELDEALHRLGSLVEGMERSIGRELDTDGDGGSAEHEGQGRSQG